MHSWPVNRIFVVSKSWYRHFNPTYYRGSRCFNFCKRHSFCGTVGGPIAISVVRVLLLPYIWRYAGM